tara:strand:- start:252 stop:1244 length:993 start_codon:yes stop_codon:yes gene_type:complete
MLFRKKNNKFYKNFIIILFISLLFLTIMILFSNKSSCLKILNNNVYSFFKINFKCVISKNKTLGERNKFYYHKFDEFNRYHSLYNKKKQSCGINKRIILVIGQSNAANEIKVYNSIETKSLNYYNGQCYDLTNPVLGATGVKDNIAVPISSKINKQNQFIFLTHAWSGTGILDWGSDKYSYLTSYVKKQLSVMESKGHRLSYIIWIQGEYDSRNFSKLDKGQGPGFYEKFGKNKYYVKSFNIILKDLFKGKMNYDNVKVVLTKTSICRNKTSAFITDQQERIALNNKNIFITQVTDNLDNSFRYDGCHLNEEGADKTAEAIAEIINSIEN